MFLGIDNKSGFDYNFERMKTFDNAVIYGKTGTGKSMLMYEDIKEKLFKGYQVYLFTSKHSVCEYSDLERFFNFHLKSHDKIYNNPIFGTPYKLKMSVEPLFIYIDEGAILTDKDKEYLTTLFILSRGYNFIFTLSTCSLEGFSEIILNCKYFILFRYDMRDICNFKESLVFESLLKEEDFIFATARKNVIVFDTELLTKNLITLREISKIKEPVNLMLY